MTPLSDAVDAPRRAHCNRKQLTRKNQTAADIAVEKGHTALAERLAELDEEFGKQEKLSYATVEVRPPPDSALAS